LGISFARTNLDQLGFQVIDRFLHGLIRFVQDEFQVFRHNNILMNQLLTGMQTYIKRKIRQKDS